MLCLKNSVDAVKKILRRKRLDILRKKIISYCKEHYDAEFREIGEYLESNALECYNYYYTRKYKELNVNVCYDKKLNLFYVVHKNKKMYMKKGWTESQVKNYYRFIEIEQDELSPHLYFTKELQNKSFRKVVDLGAAEGNFTLEIIDRCDKAYIFECDSGWIEALNATFAPWKEKVTIVPTFVSNVTRENMTTLDQYFKDNLEEIDLLKIDIEGQEIQALQGAKKILDQNKQIRMLICAYHYQNEESEIQAYLNGWHLEHRNGYIVMIDDKRQKKPYLRRGILEASRMED